MSEYEELVVRVKADLGDAQTKVEAFKHSFRDVGGVEFTGKLTALQRHLGGADNQNRKHPIVSCFGENIHPSSYVSHL
jgi:hypothetical protein